MGEENTETTQTPPAAEPTPEAVIKYIQDVVGKMNIGNGAVAAAGTEGTAPDGVTSKGTTPQERKTAFVDPLRSAFEKLATYHPAYARLGTTRVLDDPYGYLSATYPGDPTRKVVKMQELDAMCSVLLSQGQGKEGVPLDKFVPSNQIGLIERAFERALSAGHFDRATSKILDTYSSNQGGALIRTDLEPILYEAYLRRFPFVDAVRTIPANGLVHTYDVRSAPGTAANIAEVGDLTSVDTQSTIERKANANIAVIATKRGISLKLQFAVAQSGMNFPITGGDNLEVVGGVTAIANKNQYNLLQGNFSTNTKTLDDEEGLTDANGYDGLRTLLKGAGTSSTKGASDKYRDVFNKAIASMANAGAEINDLRLVMSYGARYGFDAEFIDFLRILNTVPAGGFPTNLAANGFVGINDFLNRLIVVPSGAQAAGIGYYTYSGSVVEDVYIIDPNQVALAYLGGPAPVVLELPMGYNNTLSSVYIVFLMNGLVLYIPAFNRKVRIPRVTI